MRVVSFSAKIGILAVLSILVIGCASQSVNSGTLLSNADSRVGRIYTMPHVIRLNLLDDGPPKCVDAVAKLSGLLNTNQSLYTITSLGNGYILVAVQEGGFSYVVQYIMQFQPILLDTPSANCVELDSWTVMLLSDDPASADSQTMDMARQQADQFLRARIQAALTTEPLKGRISFQGSF